jgi:hypothetical protein
MYFESSSKTPNSQLSTNLHIPAHIGFDLLFAAASAIFTGRTIGGKDPEQDKKDGKEFGCFFHETKDTKCPVFQKVFYGTDDEWWLRVKIPEKTFGTSHIFVTLFHAEIAITIFFNFILCFSRSEGELHPHSDG